MELDDAAFIVYRTRCTIGHSLGHVVYIDVIAEDFPCAPVLQRDGGSCKTDIGSLWEAVANDAGNALDNLRDLFPGGVRDHLDFFCQTVLPPVSLIRHDNNVPAL